MNDMRYEVIEIRLDVLKEIKTKYNVMIDTKLKCKDWAYQGISCLPALRDHIETYFEIENKETQGHDCL